MREFTVGEHTYRAGQLDAMRQFHIMRRISPVLVSLGVTVGADGKAALGNPFAALSPAAEILAGMSDENAEYVINTCLSVAQRKQGKAWSPVMANGVMMFSADLDMVAMLQIVWEVGQANLGDFMNTFQSLGGMAKAAQAGSIS